MWFFSGSGALHAFSLAKPFDQQNRNELDKMGKHKGLVCGESWQESRENLVKEFALGHSWLTLC